MIIIGLIVNARIRALMVGVVRQYFLVFFFRFSLPLFSYLQITTQY